MVRKSYKRHEIEIPQENDPNKTVSKNAFLSESLHGEDGMFGFEPINVAMSGNQIAPKDTFALVTRDSENSDLLNFIDIDTTPDIKIGDAVVLVNGGTEDIFLVHNAAGSTSRLRPLLLHADVPTRKLGTAPVVLILTADGFEEITSYFDLETMFIPMGNESSPPTTNSVVFTKYMPKDGVFFDKVFAEATVAPTGSSIIMDVKKNGETIFKTGEKPEIAATEHTGEGTLETENKPLAFAKGDKIEFSYATLDSGGTAAGVKLNLLFYYT